jgi:asparagine N-glycosylation enzyme membrane subunit Stt3
MPFQRAAGRHAVFYVVPLLGALCVFMTSVLGTAVHGRLTGLMAALLLVASPSFMTELMAPASDVAATAWWTVALALTVRGGSLGALGAGAAVSAAVLTRGRCARANPSVILVVDVDSDPHVGLFPHEAG